MVAEEAAKLRDGEESEYKGWAGHWWGSLGRLLPPGLTGLAPAVLRTVAQAFFSQSGSESSHLRFSRSNNRGGSRLRLSSSSSSSRP